MLAVCGFCDVAASNGQPSKTSGPTHATKAPGAFPGAGGILRTQINVPGLKPSDRRYAVDLTIAGESKPGMQPVEMKIPTMTLGDCEEASLQDTKQSKFLVSMADHGTVPIVRDIWEGTKIDVYVVGVDNDKVVVDIDARVQSTNGTAKYSPSIQVHRATARVVEEMTLGETKNISVDGGKFQITVNAAK
jgi:hypothetical protein